jgi:hypothetical protein
LPTPVLPGGGTPERTWVACRFDGYRGLLDEDICTDLWLDCLGLPTDIPEAQPARAPPLHLVADAPPTEVLRRCAFSRTSTDRIPRCLEELWRCGKLQLQDTVLVTSVGYPRSGNRMNLIEMHLIGDLRDTLGWCAGASTLRLTCRALDSVACGRRTGRAGAARVESIRTNSPLSGQTVH